MKETLERIPVVIPVYDLYQSDDRYDYLVRFLRSLEETIGRDRADFIFFDDKITDKRFKKALEETSLPHTIFVENDTPKRRGATSNIEIAFQYGFNNYSSDFVIKIDPDTIHHFLWLAKTVSIFNNYSEVFPDIAIVTPYLRNKKLRIQRCCVNDWEPIYFVSYFSGCCVLLSRRFWGKAQRYGIFRDRPSFDQNIVKIARRLSFRLVSTQESYIQHIGRFGIHSNGGECNQSNCYIGPCY